MHDSDEHLTAHGNLRVFGCDDTTLEVTVVPRSIRWRALRAGGWMLAAVVAGALVLFPPHVLWILLALAALALGLRKWSERYTLVELQGRCPKCGGEIQETGPGRFRPDASVDCPECHHGSSVILPDEALGR